MQHSQLVVSSGNADVPAVGPAWEVPASTITLVSLSGCKHSGATTGFPDSALSGGTTPPPNFLTRVKVWVSPPKSLICNCCPAVRLSVTNEKTLPEAFSSGLNRH